MLVLSVPVLLRAGRSQWFWVDELDFFLERDLDEPASLFRSWYGHLVAIPAVAFRAVNAVWGTGSYVPYQALAIAGHLAVVVAVWLVCRRCGVRGWAATASVLPLIVLGSGRANIMIGFQITMTWALALALLQFALADRDGPFTRRDLLGLGCGLAGLLCSGVAIPVVVGTGVAVLLRRGWRVAALHTVPLGVLFSAWYLLSADSGPPRTDPTAGTATLRFAAEMLKAGFWGLGHHRAAALALVVLAVTGVAAAAVRGWRPPTDRWARLAPIGGVVVALAAWVLLTATQRRTTVLGMEGAKESRYVYVVVALLVPLIALAVEAAARHGALVVAPLAVLAVGVPGNLRLLDDDGVEYDMVWALIGSEHLDAAPDDRDLPFATIAQLKGLASVFDPPRAVDPSIQLFADGFLALHQEPGDAPDDCPTVALVRADLAPGTSVGLRGLVEVRVVSGDERSPVFPLDAAAGDRLSAYGPITVEVRRPEGAGPESGPTDCGP